ncbi:sigma-70 family RNA polymerase sigma factor [Zhihengliuella somnathii]
MAATVSDDVLEEAQRGAPEALTAIYQSLAAQVHGYLAAKGVEDAEGAAQEVFLTVFARLDEVSGGIAGLRTFTFSVAHARMVDATRARARGPQLTEYDAAADPRVAASPQDEVMSQLASSELMPALDTLGEEQRECIILRIVVGMTLEETAEIMNKSVGSIKQLQRRGLKSLKVAFEEVQAGE